MECRDVVNETLESGLVRVVGLPGAVLYEGRERPDHCEQLVVIGQHRFDTVATRVRNLDLSFSHLSDTSFDDLHLHGTVSVGAAVFVGGFAAGRCAVDAWPSGWLHVLELAAAARALRWQFGGALDASGAIPAPLPGFAQFTNPCRLARADLAEEHDQALLHLPPPRRFEVVALNGEVLIEHSTVQRGDR